MKEVTAIEKIDNLLHALNEHENGMEKLGYASAQDLASKVCLQYNITPKELTAIMITLIEDKYAHKEKGDNDDDIYFSTWKGQFFESCGGYGGKIKKDSIDQKLREDQSRSLLNSNRWIVIGTLVAASFYVKELSVWVYNFLICCKH